MAVGNITLTTAANFVPEIWSAQTLDFRQANLVNAMLVDRSFESDAKFGDTVHVPNITELTTRSKAAQTDITYENFTETVTDILIDTHKYAAIKIEDIVEVQSKYNLREKYVKQFAYVLAKDLDTAVASIYDGGSQTLGTLTVGLTDADLRRAVQYLNDANAPTTGRAWVFSPAEVNSLMGIDRLVNKDYNLSTLGANISQQGMIGAIYGIPAYETTNLEGSNAAGHDNVLLQESAIALIVQQGVKVESQYDLDSVAFKTVAHQIYGKKEMRDDHLVWLQAK